MGRNHGPVVLLLAWVLVCAESDEPTIRSDVPADIVFAESAHTCCFTKAYFSYARGTGSVLARPRLHAHLRET